MKITHTSETLISRFRFTADLHLSKDLNRLAFVRPEKQRYKLKKREKYNFRMRMHCNSSLERELKQPE